MATMNHQMAFMVMKTKAIKDPPKRKRATKIKEKGITTSIWGIVLRQDTISKLCQCNQFYKCPQHSILCNSTNQHSHSVMHKEIWWKVPGRTQVFHLHFNQHHHHFSHPPQGYCPPVNFGYALPPNMPLYNEPAHNPLSKQYNNMNIAWRMVLM